MALATEAARGAALWASVDALVDRAPSDEDVESHRIEILAARRRRSLGLPVPDAFLRAEKLAALSHLTAPLVFDRVRAAYGGPLIVLKGPETAALYPDPTLRGFGDLDLLVEDAEGVHATLVAAGFVEVGDPAIYRDIHHLRPLARERLPLTVEVHSRPKWIDDRGGPSAAELFAAAHPSTALAGALALPPEHHAVLLAVHSWAHEPLRRLRDLVDVAAALAAADPARTAAVAEEWGVGRLWRVTAAAADAVFFGAPDPWALRLWALNLRRVRERTVLEQHVQRWTSDFSALPFSSAARRVPRTFASEVFPEGDEGWRAKLARTALAVRDAFRRRSYHHRALDRQSPRE